MADTAMIEAARRALVEASGRTEGLIESLGDLTTPIPRSTWTVREAAVHLVTVGAHYAGMIDGEANQYPSLDPETCSRLNAELVADIPAPDAVDVATLIREATQRLIASTGRCDDGWRIPYHCASRIAAPELVAIAAAEHLVHGYDIARAARRPWPIGPDEAVVALRGYGPCFGLCLNPRTSAGHSAAYGIELTTGERFTVRFVDGAYRQEPADSGPVEATITAEPVAFLLAGSGRMSQWAAVTLGLLGFGGSRPDLAAGFLDLFLFP